MKYTALVIDDELHGRENILFLVNHYLSQVEVVGEAADLDEAERLVLELRPDIIFLDIHIGEETGFDLIDRLGNHKSAIIIVSGDDDYGIMAVKKGVIDYVLKPISPDDLMAAVAKASAFIDQQKAHQIIQQSQQKSGELLENMLPGQTLDELLKGGKVEPRIYPNVSVMFADFKGFTFIAERMAPIELITKLDTYFARFDEIVQRQGLDKIKTMGDGYLCAAGLREDDAAGQARRLIRAAIEMQDFVKEKLFEDNQNGSGGWELRIGIHTGEIVAGIVGRSKLAYDIWGDTVNYANRLQSLCEPGKIAVSGNTAQFLAEDYQVVYRGKMQGKNNEEFEVYYVDTASVS